VEREKWKEGDQGTKRAGESKEKRSQDHASPKNGTKKEDPKK
jgi:hypothetical protein